MGADHKRRREGSVSQPVRLVFQGVFEENGALNPFPSEGGLFDSKADYTVGAVHRGGEMGNWYRSLLGGLAVYDRALSAAEMKALADSTLPVAWDKIHSVR